MDEMLIELAKYRVAKALEDLEAAKLMCPVPQSVILLNLSFC
ncbi:hypothetical protein CACET_c04730 [Clostridium aceticum]|uniref:Uncharacterized protein n=1 Tax=Clostridium aceticum TaxID=84022 RepID=A0A0G3W6M1_9CLOT|nr:hypothetical protein [Clostridium aceticum]AKL93983.1 hypothetical protein CACET_c04730 [Clostridium aceticum]